MPSSARSPHGDREPAWRGHDENTSYGVQPKISEGGTHSHMPLALQGRFVCECCPKKPKNFDTEKELRLHESEKQYTCAYCPNRFKSKTEAERHQNSLHLRKHSWSCAALSGIEAAFHRSASSAVNDVCGYCGIEFANPPQWEHRSNHLTSIHKFGECNQAKKFFRVSRYHTRGDECLHLVRQITSANT